MFTRKDDGRLASHAKGKKRILRNERMIENKLQI